jgi:hypothetical protein
MIEKEGEGYGIWWKCAKCDGWINSKEDEIPENDLKVRGMLMESSGTIMLTCEETIARDVTFE